MADLDDVVVPADLYEAVQLVLKSWPLLHLSVTNEWGGPDTKEKAEWLAGVLGQVLAAPKKIEVFGVEDILDDIMSEEFEVVADDGSIAQVARLLVRLRDELAAGDESGLVELRARRTASGDSLKAALKGSAADASAGNDDEDVDEEGGEWEDEDAAMDGEAPKASSSSASTKAENKKPEPDADGWTTVPTKGRRR